MKNYHCTVDEAILDIKKGKILILVDRKDRENEGDFFFPGQLVSSDKVNFMITNGKGLLCVALDADLAKKLAINHMVQPQQNSEKTGVNFGASVNAAAGITTGVSAFDRAKTIKVLSNEKSQPSELTRPGHVFPLIASRGGLLERDGHTEAAVELSLLSGFSPSGVLCEIIRADGRMAKIKDLNLLASEFDLKILSISDLKSYIRSR